MKTEQYFTIGSVKQRHRNQIRKLHLQSIFREIRSSKFYNTTQIPKCLPSPYNKKLNIMNIQNPSDVQQHINIPNISYVQNKPDIQKQYLKWKMAKIKSQQQKLIPLKQYIDLKIKCQPKFLSQSQIKGYKIFNKLIGEGSYSKVYQGEHIVTKKKVAIKQVQQIQQNEVQCLASFKSPYIVQMQAHWKQNGKTYIVLQYCQKNLRQQLKFCSKNQAIQYFKHVIMGMDCLIQRKIIHRDIKFENILIKNKIAKISDFGLAKTMGNRLAVQSCRCGTPYTMPPQILFYMGTGKPYYTLKCDIWSLGILFHQILYDCHPFDYNAERMRSKNRLKIQKKYPQYDDLIDKALQFNQNKRIDWKKFKSIVQQKNNNHQQYVVKHEVYNLKKAEKNQQIKIKAIYESPVYQQKLYRIPEIQTKIQNSWLTNNSRQDYLIMKKKQNYRKFQHFEKKQIVIKKINVFEQIIQPKKKRINYSKQNYRKNNQNVFTQKEQETHHIPINKQTQKRFINFSFSLPKLNIQNFLMYQVIIITCMILFHIIFT